MTGRIDSASRVIAASPAAVWRAFTDAGAIAAWRRPEGMRARIEWFDARTGGGYRMALIYEDPAGAPGKSSADEDVFEGRFAELAEGERLVEQVEFESDDPDFAGTMTITTTLRAVPGGTEVRIACSDVPPGIGAEDHAKGLASSLANLAAYLES